MQLKGRINWRAVLTGYFLDTVLSIIIGPIGSTIDPNIERGNFFASSTGILVGVLLALSTIFGGWLAGRIAQEERFLHGFLVGGIGIVLMLLLSFGTGPITLDQLVLQFIATGLAGVAGYMSRWTPVRQQK